MTKPKTPPPTLNRTPARNVAPVPAARKPANLPPAPTRVPEIPIEIQDQNGAISSLEDSLNALVERLTPVTGCPPLPLGLADDPSLPGSSIGLNIRAVTQRIRFCYTQVDDLLARLEV